MRTTIDPLLLWWSRRRYTARFRRLFPWLAKLPQGLPLSLLWGNSYTSWLAC